MAAPLSNYCSANNCLCVCMCVVVVVVVVGGSKSLLGAILDDRNIKIGKEGSFPKEVHASVGAIAIQLGVNPESTFKNVLVNLCIHSTNCYLAHPLY